MLLFLICDENDHIGSGSCPVAGFVIRDVERIGESVPYRKVSRWKYKYGFSESECSLGQG